MSLFASIKNRLDSGQPTKSKKNIIAFINQKGGVGKTTMAFNTAHALAVRGKKVLCLDMDPQANLSQMFGVEETPERHVFHLLINSLKELRALHTPAMFDNTKIEVGERIDLIPSGQDLSGFELTVAGISSPRQTILKRFLEKNYLPHLYDVIIIDAPPTLGLLVVNILCASHGVMIPFRPDNFSRHGLGHFYQALEDIEEMGITHAPEVLAHIPNLVDSRRKQEGQDLSIMSEEIDHRFGEHNLIEPFFNKSLLVKAHAQKKSVFEYQSKDFVPLKKQFEHMAALIEKHSDEVRE